MEAADPPSPTSSTNPLTPATLPDDDEIREQFVVGAVSFVVERTLTRIDVTRSILLASESIRDALPDASREVKKNLTAAQRKQLDEILDDFEESMPELLSQAEDNFLSNLPGDVVQTAARSSYPLSAEQAGAAAALLVRGAGLQERFVAALGEHAKDPASTAYVNARLLDLTRRELPDLILGESILPSVVSTFEEYLKSVVRLALTAYPNGLGDLPSIPAQLLDRYGEKFDLRRWQIDQKVDSFIRSGPDDWRRRVEQWLKLDMARQGGDWSVIVEGIQRRHVIVHNGGRADDQYRKAVSDREVAEGELLRCDRPYLIRLLAEIECLILVFAMNYANHLARASASAISSRMSYTMVEMERQRRWGHALALAEAGERYATDDREREVYQINRWYCLQELGREDHAMVGAIYRFAPTELNYRLGRAALLRDESAALELCREINKTTKATVLKRTLRGSPLVQRLMQDSPKVKRALTH